MVFKDIKKKVFTSMIIIRINILNKKKYSIIIILLLNILLLLLLLFYSSIIIPKSLLQCNIY